MPQFQPDQVSFGDAAGYGAWDIGHAREHLQFVTLLAGKSPSVLIPAYDFLQMLTAGQARQSIALAHAQAHQLLRAALGLTGVDLSVVNFDAQDNFYAWLGYHATEHAQMRQQLGIT